MSKEDSIMDDKEFKKDRIHKCLIEFIGLHLTGMDDYFKKCWTETGMVKGVSSYNKWFEECRISGSVCDIIGEWWYETFKDKEKEFKEFLENSGFSDYMNKFLEDFKVEIVWIHPPVGRDRLDIDVIML